MVNLSQVILSVRLELLDFSLDTFLGVVEYIKKGKIPGFFTDVLLRAFLGPFIEKTPPFFGVNLQKSL